MSRWFRMYDDLIDDPKVQRLPAELFKTWVNLLCLASKHGGTLPPLDDMAFALRMGPQEAERHVTDLVGRGLIDCNDDALSPHNWNARQYKSDNDPTAAERQRRRRSKSQDVTDDVTRDTTVTSRPPEAEAEAEQKQSRAEADRALAQEILKDTSFEIDDYDDGLLSNLVGLENWSKKQREKFDVIAQRYRERGSGRGSEPLFTGPRPTTSNGKVYVKVQTPQWDAWTDWYRKNRKTSPPTDQSGGWWFETEYPTEAKAS